MVSGKGYFEENKQLFNAVFSFFFVLLGILTAPSLLALLNTLTIGVLERTREIGMLRAIGATRKQVQPDGHCRVDAVGGSRDVLWSAGRIIYGICNGARYEGRRLSGYLFLPLPGVDRSHHYGFGLRACGSIAAIQTGRSDGDRQGSPVRVRIHMLEPHAGAPASTQLP